MMHKSCETLLMDYAAGTLDTAHNILVASYLTLSPEGRRYVAECETLGAALMEHGCECAEMSATCLDSVLAKIDCTEQDCATAAPCTDSSLENCAAIPQPLSRALPTKSGKPAKWHRAFGGMEWLDLSFDDSKTTQTRLIRCKPGFALPHHAHRGSEVTLVLDGAFEDVTGRYERGALVVMDEETDHEPKADMNAGCIILTITERPIRFTGLFTRMLNPFI